MLMSTICGMHVVQTNEKDKLRRIGKVRSFVFHPSEKRVVGILVKRRDAAMMFHRKDVFVRFGAFSLEEEGSSLQIDNARDATDSRAERALGVKLADCVLWWGMPITNENGESVGCVNDVDFGWKTGVVNSIEVDLGSMAKTALLGKLTIDAKDIVGFKRGTGKPLVTEEGDWDEEAALGCIMVRGSITEKSAEGGLAQAAGEASAKTQKKVRVVVNKAKTRVNNEVGSVAKVAGDATNKASYAAGEKIGERMVETKGMFKSFKDEFKRAYNSDDE